MEGRQSVSVIPDIKIFINPLYCPTTVSETDDEKEEHARRKLVLTKLFTNPLYFPPTRFENDDDDKEENVRRRQVIARWQSASKNLVSPKGTIETPEEYADDTIKDEYAGGITAARRKEEEEEDSGKWQYFTFLKTSSALTFYTL